ncbi:protein kinase domain-containing protein [Leptospira meyeri]|uniref:protein kinase domain-containing protein n=1 Tax=Leptospira meyeri TaxID=29508 RepID=UPI000C2B17BC|nr:protein kinase [Leptospira meyeri]PJZ81302.1 hypothetical protein CH359_09505 [Leptospira meyeri]PJZ96808.1 hypothetical protein CH358_11175 [Leptospira meyeri]
MDELKANSIFNELKDKQIEGITVNSYINHGKSAAVFLGKNGNEKYAIKIFDHELIERFGVEIQLNRINLELSLRNHEIKNLVKIISGNEIKLKNTKYFYLIMEYIEGINLKQYIETKKITNEFIVQVASTLIATSEKLIQNKPPLAHRDIKPENIMVTNSGEIILMDLGVLKIIDNPSMTDIGQKQFLGTLRYSPPEFLMRNEEDSVEGWRSVNLYQIGAVIHDLITKNELFHNSEPYTNLVIAIKEDMPKITNSNFHPDLIQLTRNLLTKDWKTRLKINDISKINLILDSCLKASSDPINLFDAIKQKSINVREELDEISKIERDIKEKKEISERLHKELFNLISKSVNQLKQSDIIESIEQSSILKYRLWKEKDFHISYQIFKINAKLDFGFSKPVYIFFKIDNNANSFVKIHALGILMPKFFKPNFNNSDQIIADFFLENKTSYHQKIESTSIQIKTNLIFEGIFEPTDITFETLLNKTLQAILFKANEILEPEVKDELKNRKRIMGIGSNYANIFFSEKREYITDF